MINLLAGRHQVTIFILIVTTSFFFLVWYSFFLRIAPQRADRKVVETIEKLVKAMVSGTLTGKEKAELKQNPEYWYLSYLVPSKCLEAISSSNFILSL